jgi:hypothetical protein
VNEAIFNASIIVSDYEDGQKWMWSGFVVVE